MIKAHVGEFTALAVAMFWCVSALAFESASKAVGSLAVNVIRLLFGFVFLTVFTWFFRGNPLPTDATAYQWMWLSLSGFVGFVLGDLFLFKSYTIIGSRVAMLVMTMAPPIAAVIGWIFLGEKLSALSMLGISLTMLGISLTILSRGAQEERMQLNLPIKGLLFAFGGAVGQAAGLVLSKKGMAGYDAFAATQIRIIVGISGFSLLTILLGRTKQTVAVFGNKKGMLGITIGSFFGLFLGVSLSLYSLKFTSTGIASSIMATVPILIIPPTVLIFKQKVTSKEIAGAILSVIGVALFFV